MLVEYIKIDDELLDKHANMFAREFRSQVPKNVQNKITENMCHVRLHHLDSFAYTVKKLPIDFEIVKDRL